jgi:hypothetical protein
MKILFDSMHTKKFWIFIVLSFALGGGGGIVIAENKLSPKPSGVVEVLSFNELQCLSQNRLATIRSNPKNGVMQALESCSEEISEKLKSLQLTKSEERIAFLSILAHSMAPYGKSSSILLEDL